MARLFKSFRKERRIDQKLSFARPQGSTCLEDNIFVVTPFRLTRYQKLYISINTRYRGLLLQILRPVLKSDSVQHA